MTIFFYYICTFGFSESSGGFGATSKAFIFSLNNNEGLAPFVSKVKPKYTGKAIYRDSYRGPCFGKDVFIPETASQEQAWAITTLLHQQWRSRPQSWPGLSTSHLMRWRYFILTHLPKCKITQTIIFITIKSEYEATAFTITLNFLLINCFL